MSPEVGAAGWEPISGDWDGDGYDEVGSHDPATRIWRMKTDITWNTAVKYLVCGSGIGDMIHVAGKW